MYRRHLVSSFAVLLLAVCGTASAQNAYTARSMGLHAGPDRDYPLVAQVDEGTPVEVHGCLDGWSWCDVSVEGGRGWMYGGGIYFDYNGGTDWLYSYGPQVGVPIITFSVDSYWGQYYQGRRWYGQRETWAHRHFTRPARLARPSGQPPRHGAHGPGPRQSGGSHGSGPHHTSPHQPSPRPEPRPATHARAPVAAHHVDQTHGHAPSPAMHGHAPSSETRGHASSSETRGAPKGGHAQRPPSSHGSSAHSEHGNGDKNKPHNPP
jgi:uncharacterized protein YraI